MNASRYARRLLVVFALAFTVITAGLFFVEPFQGDLTRVGAFREAEFRWTEPQRFFTAPHTQSASSLDEYRTPCDILVIGDSFTQYIFNQCYGWQEFVYQQTGLRILTIHVDHLDIARLFDHPVFKQTPPRFVIYESAEMGLATKLEAMDGLSAAPERAPALTPFCPQAQMQPPEPLAMINRNWQSGPRLAMDTVIYFYRTRIKQLLGGRAKAYKIPLRAGHQPFSSPCKDSMLIYYGEFWKFEPDAAAWARTRQRFDTLRSHIEANGCSQFFLLVAPDRSSVYADDIATNPVITPRPLAQLTHAFDTLPQIDALHGLKTAVTKGEKDVYLPNDSHWGWKGHALVADAVVQALFPDQQNRENSGPSLSAH